MAVRADRWNSRHHWIPDFLLRAPVLPSRASYTSLTSQEGNFPVFEGTSLYSLRIDHNLNANHRLTFRANVSPSTSHGN